MLEPNERDKLVPGRKVWVEHDDRKLLAEVVARPEDEQLAVRWHVGVGRAETATVPLEAVSLASLSSQQRVYVPQENRWEIGRLITRLATVTDNLRHYHIVFPGQRVQSLREDQFHVDGGAEPADPIDALLARGAETPFFFEQRTRFLRSLVAQRAAAGGLTALLSARVELFRHQVEAVRRVLHDPKPRYLLADEDGLGRAIEAGAVIRQRWIDDPASRIVILAEPRRVERWTTLLWRHFDLVSDETEGGNIRLRVLPHDDVGRVGETPDLLVIDAAHRLTGKKGVAGLCAKAPRLLLLCGLPVPGHEAEYAELLAWIDGTEADPAALSARIRDRAAFGREALALNADPSAQAVSLLTTLRHEHRLHARILRSTRRFLRERFPRRVEPEVQVDLDPDRRQAQWKAFENWRVWAAGHAEQSPEQAGALAAVFAELLQSLASWGCGRLVRARLGKPPKNAPDAAAMKTVIAVPTAPTEEPLLRGLLDELEKDSDGDRLELLVKTFELESRRRQRQGHRTALPRTVVFTRSAGACQEAARRVEETLRLPVASIHTGRPPADCARDLERFRTEACLVLLCDDAMAGALDLSMADRLVHLDLPLDPVAIEQRITRLDRLTRVAAQVPSMVLLCDDQGQGYDEAWFALLNDGFGVFRGHSPSLPSFAAELTDALVKSAFRDGLSAWKDGAVEQVRAATEQADTDLAAQDVLDAPDLDAGQALTFYDRLHAYEEDVEPFVQALHGYLKEVNKIDVHRLQRESPVEQKRYHDKYGALMQENWFEEILPHLVRPFDFDRSEAQKRHDRPFLRLGHTLIDTLQRIVRFDDRGKAFALWRPVRGLGAIQPYLRLHAVIEVDADALTRSLAAAGIEPARRRELLRLADGFAPPRVETWYLDEQGQPVTDAKLLDLLGRPYEKRTGDRNLGNPERAGLIDDRLGQGRWDALCRQGREALPKLIAATESYRSAGETAVDHLQTSFAGAESELAALLTAAVQTPAIRLDAAGILLLAGEACPA